MTITIIVLIITIAMFIWGRVRGDIVALSSLMVLTATGVLTTSEALSGFSSPILIMMVGLFVVGGAILQTGLAQSAGNSISKMAKGNETRALIYVVLATSIIGAFVSNTGTVAIMMPIIMSMAASSGIRSSRLLMPVAFAGSLGGMLTLIGTPPNLVISETLEENGYAPLKFFSFFPVGVIVIAIGLAVLLPMSLLLIKKIGKHQNGGQGKSVDDLAVQYQLHENIYKYSVGNNKGGLAGMRVQDLDLQNKYGLTILEIRNETKNALGKEIRQNMAWADTMIVQGDILYFYGDKQAMETFARERHLVSMSTDRLDFYDIGISEIVVLPTSRLIGTRIRDSRLREDYSVNILSIHRDKKYIKEELSEHRLQNGDILLVQGQWEKIMQMNHENENWVVLGRPDKLMERVSLDYKAPVAAAIMLLMIVMMVFDFIPIAPVVAVVSAALLMVFAGCFRSVDAAYKTINWESVMLIACMMPMSIALEKTGVSQIVSENLVRSLGALGPYALLAGMYFTTSLMTMFISNTATAVLMAPIALTAAQQIGVSPYSFMFAVTLGASMCFASPFSTPPNALVMKAGRYTFMDYIIVGLPLQIIIGIVMTIILPLLFPF
ncbi:SLC13 family permease [Prevotella brevis]|uniref:SLC13 family permease n=1 Tax=Xylanibacter brevis TaxID=83231 RepID=A0ABS9CFC5_9BACT|nr:SLC13 family permease [Xylanibacter brevis]MCF2563457.1 SLC13 family permease [Xylanibacter brevis]